VTVFVTGRLDTAVPRCRSSPASTISSGTARGRPRSTSASGSGWCGGASGSLASGWGAGTILTKLRCGGWRVGGPSRHGRRQAGYGISFYRSRLARRPCDGEAGRSCRLADGRVDPRGNPWIVFGPSCVTGRQDVKSMRLRCWRCDHGEAHRLNNSSAYGLVESLVVVVEMVEMPSAPSLATATSSP
jgi:hypothetical protein